MRVGTTTAEARLEPAGSGRFTMANAPGYLQFGPIIDGQAISACLMGGLYSRVNTP
jgi:hypothetical protein